MGALGRWFAGTNTQPTSTTSTSPSPNRTIAEQKKQQQRQQQQQNSNSSSFDSVVAAPTPTSSHSFSSPSPSPQPSTPADDHSFGHRNYFGAPPSILTTSASAAKPINIATPHIRNSTASTSPHVPEPPYLDGNVNDIERDLDNFYTDLEVDTEMTTGPVLDSALGRSRQDSFVSAGPKPISMNNPNRDQANRGRRESLAGSLMNGMSWGGVSVGSFIKDDLMMAGTSPWQGAPQSSSFHSNSYIPKMEADYLRNFLCCNQQLDTFHDLLRHYETVHTGANAQPAATKPPGIQMPHRMSLSRPSVSSGSMTAARHDSHGLQGQGQMGFGQQNRSMGAGGGAGLGFNSLQMGGQPQSAVGANGQKQPQMPNLQPTDEMDAVGDMEMDDAVGLLEMDDASQRTIQQTRQMFGQQQRPQLHINSMPQQALRTSQPSTPGAANFGYQNNPTVSSVNTPTLTTPRASQQLGTDAIDDDLSAMGNNMNIGGDFSAFDATSLEYFIDDPAKRLYSPNGGPASQRALQQQMAQFGLDQNQFGNITDPNHILALQRAIANPGSIMIPPEEDKPFKCPVIGCEKAYKNQNGLKYHKQHGHQNQQLHENGDGTFSIVNPETSAPYPGETGMEKEKPHKCEYCHKRYKNLNGLKYHKQHSTPCEIAAQAATLRAGLANGQMPAFNNLGHGLPGIGEDMQM